jgi:hypothetical protein
MADEWFYTQNGQQCGPVDFPQLQGLAASGSIHPSDLIWKQGMPNWAAASTIAGIFQAPPSPPPAPPPAQGYAPPPQGYAQAPAPFPQQSYGQPSAQGHVGMAITSFVLSLVGLIACLGGILLGLLAIIFGGVAISASNRTGDRRGRGLAVAGLIIGIFDVICWSMWTAAVRRHGGWR